MNAHVHSYVPLEVGFQLVTVIAFPGQVMSAEQRILQRFTGNCDVAILRGFDPLLLFFMNEIKIVSYSFSSSVIEYNSNEKLLKA